MKGLLVITISMLAVLCKAKTLVKRDVDLIQSNEIPLSNSIQRFKIDPSDLPTPQANSKQSVTSSVQNFLSSPIVQSTLTNFTIQNVLSDPTIQAVLMNPAVQNVLLNPIVQSILTNPQLTGLALQAITSSLSTLSTTPMPPAAAPVRPNRTTRPTAIVNSRPTPSIMELVLNGLDDILQMLQSQISRTFPRRTW